MSRIAQWFAWRPYNVKRMYRVCHDAQRGIQLKAALPMHRGSNCMPRKIGQSFGREDFVAIVGVEVTESNEIHYLYTHMTLYCDDMATSSDHCMTGKYSLTFCVIIQAFPSLATEPLCCF